MPKRLNQMKIYQWLTETSNSPKFQEWLAETSNAPQLQQWLTETSNAPQLLEHLNRSYLFLRKFIGIIGVVLPPVLIIGLILLERQSNILDSISSYYYSDGQKNYNVIGNIFVGSMCATGVFLISYRYERLDFLVSTLAGIFAILVALFPTTPNTGATIVQGWIGIAHGLFAAAFLSALAYMVLVLFRKSDPNPTDEKITRNKIYLGCGIAMIVFLVLAGIYDYVPGANQVGWLAPLQPNLWLETLSVEAFGIAWFVKGETFGILKDRVSMTVQTPIIQNGTTRKVATALGVSGGLIGLIHGFFEIRQGLIDTPTILIHATGQACQANLAWHQCLPAVTILPNLLATGIMTMIVSVFVIIWSARFVGSTYGGQILILLAITQLLVGGGYLSAILCLIAGLVGLMISSHFTWLRKLLSVDWQQRLASIWLYALIASGLWLVLFCVTGIVFNDFIIKPVVFQLYIAISLLVLVVLVALAILAGFANDMLGEQQQPETVPAAS